MKKKLSLLLALLMIVSVLTGCQKQAPAAPSAESTEEIKPIVLQVGSTTHATISS